MFLVISFTFNFINYSFLIYKLIFVFLEIWYEAQ